LNERLLGLLLRQSDTSKEKEKSAMTTSPAYTHAVVLGASMAGLLTARVLSDHFDRVTIVERDPVEDAPLARKGQPQTRHLHGLLSSGLQILARLYPDLPDALRAGGAIVSDMGEGMNWHTFGGRRLPATVGLEAALMSRPFLEQLVRQRTLARPNIALRDSCTVAGLLAGAGRRVAGVQLEPRDGEASAELLADLVVDCGGRGSRSPAWLQALGYPAPETSEVRVDVGYATRTFRRNPADPRGGTWTLFTPEGPRETRFGGLFPIEGDRWIVSMGGWAGDHCPTDEAGFLTYARSLPVPEIAEIVAHAEPLSPIVAYKFSSSLRRHYERLREFPEGYLVLGDAICSFNPTYGQGMTSAAMQAQALDALLTARRGRLDGLAPRFFARAAKVVDTPWQLAVGEDFRFPQTSGPRPAGVDLLNRYVAMVHRATHTDAEVTRAFLKVMNLLAPPSSLMAPRILLRVLRAARHAAAPIATPRRAAPNPRG
jgi:2-polyprenyl-6-methoxyphenol hydroxylase-like FAD-dependent oxidoreductase